MLQTQRSSVYKYVLFYYFYEENRQKTICLQYAPYNNLHKANYCYCLGMSIIKTM